MSSNKLYPESAIINIIEKESVYYVIGKLYKVI
jgi:hypothetical protein